MLPVLKAKISVDLIMAIECSLKPMIVSLSKNVESPQQAYRTVRQQSHYLDRLYEEVKIRAKNGVRLLSIDDEATILKANSLGVGYRYNLNSFMFLSQGNWADRAIGEGSVNSIINHKFINHLSNVAHLLNDLSNKNFEKYLGWYARINVLRHREIEDRHTNFLNNLNRRL